MHKLSEKTKQRIIHIGIDVAIGVGVLGLLIGGVLLLWVSTLEIPDLSAFEQRRVLQSTKIYDRTGEVLLYDLHQDVKRTIVPYEEISRHIKNATVAIEDDSFFEHSGIRPLSIIRAVLANLQGGNLLGGQGGSTITQQVIKNSVLMQEKTLSRKVKEWILALKLERELSKDQILGHYLNESPYGGTLYGVEEASRAFFGKSASNVTLAEAAYIASLPQAPTYLSPYGQHRDALEARKNLTLKRMYELGSITEEEYNAALTEEVSFKTQITTGIRAPHFVFYVREYLARTYGEELLAERGFKVITTLDAELQEKAEEIVKKYALQNETTYNAENAALVATDPKTGDILVMVGSRDYFDENIDGEYNIALANRQPGSSFKPFVYATAFKEGYTPDTVVFDLKTQFSTSCEPSFLETTDTCYAPGNYDDAFRGPMSFRNALAQSINVPAVKALYLVGISDAIKTAQDLGITTLADKARYGLTLVLGGGEVKLLEMVGAYGTFANEGERNDVTGILRIEDASGNIVEEQKLNPRRMIDRQVALQISDVLSDNAARTPSYGASSPLHFPGRDVAVKTGTTNDYRDTWIVGYTPTIAVGAWAGNNDNSSMAKKVAGFIVSPLWREFMDFAITKRPDENFAEPEATPTNLKPILRGIWFDTDTLSSRSGSIPDTSLQNTISSAHDILYFVDKDNPQGPNPRNPENDPQFSYWEYPVSLWKSGLIGASQTSGN
ncbi:PBP1A family penicillin-binding protein [Patescibacteria group bacterium]|nr:PBP1A family penicillin-binding protein [Patescibacteria group bacterium]